MFTYEELKEKMGLGDAHFVEESSEKEYQDLFLIPGNIIEAEAIGDENDEDKIQVAMDRMEERLGEEIKKAKALAFMLQYGPDVSPFEIANSQTVLFPYYTYLEDNEPIGVISASEDPLLKGKIKLYAVLFGL